MEKATTKKEKRRNIRWSQQQVTSLLQIILEKVKGNPERFEKPTAQRFYESVGKSAAMPEVSWLLFKHKMRHLRNMYTKTRQWKSEAGAGLLKAGDGSSVADYLERICPHYELLDQIYGSRKHVKVPLIVTSTDSIYQVITKSDEEITSNDYCEIKIEPDVASDAQSFTEDSINCSGAQTGSLSINGHDFFATHTPSLPEDDFNFSATHSPSFAEDSVNFSAVRKKESDSKNKKTSNNPLAAIMEIQSKRLQLEKEKFEWQKEKDKMELNVKEIERQQQLKIKQMELEMEERVRINAQQIAAENELKKFEMELKYRHSN